MKKFIVLFLLMAPLVMALSAFDIRWGEESTYSNSPANRLKQWAEGMEGRVGDFPGTGNIYYVDSNVTIEGDGSSWTNARNTLDEAIDLCTDLNGDVIYVAQGHAENLSAAGTVTCDKSGVTIIGCGNGDNRPTFTTTADVGTFLVSDASVTIYNLRFIPGVSAAAIGISITATGDYCTVVGCQFVNSGTAANEYLSMVTLASGADYVIIDDNKMVSTNTSTGCVNAITVSAGVVNRLTITYNDIQGNFITTGAIYSNQVNTNMLIAYNTIRNTATTIPCINLTAAATGFAIGNTLYGDTFGTAGIQIFDTGALTPSGNKAINTTDKTCIDIPPKPALSTQSLTAGSWEDILNKLMYVADGTGNYPASVAQESALSYIMGKGASASAATYVNTTDSLEMTSDKLGVFTGDGGTDAGDSVYADMVLAQTDLDAILADTALWDTTAELQTILFGSATPGATQAQVNKIDAATLPVSPTVGSLATFISGANGSTSLGTPCGVDKSLVDALGSNGVALVDGAVSIAGIIGIPTDADNLVASAAILENADGSIFERLETLQMKSDDALAALGVSSVGNVFYVDSVTGSDADNGTSWALAEATLAAAIADCTANKGDIIFVAPNHAESLAAAQIDINIAGITIIGLGNGSIRPTFTMSDIASSMDVTASNVMIKNIRFYSTTADTTIGVHITGDDVMLEGCEFTDTGGFEFTAAISLGSAADRVAIKNCNFVSTSGANAAEAILITSGVVDRCLIINNNIFGGYTAGGIVSDQINTNMLISNNKIANTVASAEAIDLDAAATGFLEGNTLYTDAYATALDPGSLKCIENYYVDAVDESGYLIPAMGDSTSNYLGTNSANNDATTASVVADADGSALERLEYIQSGYTQERCIEKSDGAVLNGKDSLFTITDGPILVTKMIGIVTTIIGGVANGTLQADITTPANTLALSTTVAIDNDAAGTSYRFIGATGVLTPVTLGGVIIDPVLTPDCEWLVPIGDINFLGSAARTGVIKWYMFYKPLSPLSRVTVSP